MTATGRSRSARAVTVLAGIVVMLAVVLVLLGVLARFAGGWGVPYFTVRTQFGGTCTNTFTGSRCDQLTAADVGYYADLAVPPGTSVRSARYVTTHDYSLDAVLEVPRARAPAAVADLHRAFGACKARPSALPADVRTDCVLTNDDSAGQVDDTQAGRTYTVSTGLRRDGTRLIAIDIDSR